MNRKDANTTIQITMSVRIVKISVYVLVLAQLVAMVECDLACGQGKRLIESSGECYNCLPGTWSDDTGIGCINCPAGTYSGSSGLYTVLQCTKCSAGLYSTVEAARSSLTCISCPTGTWSSIQGASQCTNCTAGKYNTLTQQTSISKCIACPAGTYSLTASATCSSCPAGTWSDTAGVSTCTNCLAGMYSTAEGASTIDTCAECPVTTYSVIGSDACTSCPAGTWSDTAGVSACTNCLAGMYSTTEGATTIDTCTSCPTGTWSATEGVAACTNCLAGTFSAVVGAITIGTCDKCPVGTYGSTEGAITDSTCISCPTGTWSATEGVAACTNCLAGTYSTEEGAITNGTCDKCPVGTYSATEGATAIGTCISCPTGTWGTTAGLPACPLSCAVGWGAETSVPPRSVCYTQVPDLDSVCACRQDGLNPNRVIEFSLDETGEWWTHTIDIAAGWRNYDTCYWLVEGNNPTATVLTLNIPQYDAMFFGSWTHGLDPYPLPDERRWDADFNQWSYYEVKSEDLGGLSGAGTPTGTNFTAPNVIELKFHPITPSFVWDPWTGYDYWPTPTWLEPPLEPQHGPGARNRILIEIKTDACRPCPVNTYSTDLGKNCLMCPTFSSSVSLGAESATVCKCQGGYGGTDGGVCTICTAGTYSVREETGSTCLRCSGSQDTVNAGSNSSSDCKCARGYGIAVVGYNQPNRCIQCDGNYYKDWVGDDACVWCTEQNCTCAVGYIVGPDDVGCTACPVGSYKSSSGVGQCEPCPPGKTSESGSGYCGCAKGYTGTSDGVGCTICGRNTYKDWIGEEPCSVCPVRTGSNEGSVNVTNCTCGSGSFAMEDGVACDACPKGSYKGWSGKGLCDSCPNGTSSAAPGGGDVQECHCEPGYTANQNGVACWATPAGTWKDWTGFFPVNDCPAGTSSPPASVAQTACKCVVGYTASSDGVQCTVCGAGTYKNWTGKGECTVCPAGTYNDMTGAEECSSCPVFSSSTPGSDTLQKCTCIAGYQGTSTSCTACTAGTYKSTAGTGVCLPCTAGTYNDLTGVAVCSICPPGTSSLPGSDMLHNCTACKVGTYKPATGPGMCVPCTAGTYSNKTGAEECSICPFATNSTPESDSLQNCTCIAGYQGTSTGASCTACITGTYKSAIGTGVCMPCAAGTYCDTTGAEIYLTCPPGTSSPPASDTIHNCTCLAGYQGTSTGASCTACIAGEYKSDVGPGVCVPCTAGMYCNITSAEMCPSGTSSPLGSYTLQSCTCLSGYQGTSTGASCTACLTGTYKSALGTGVCEPCMAGTYCDTPGTEIYLTCPPGTSSPPGSDTINNCTCIAGYQGTSTGASCTACLTGTYKSALGTGVCEPCMAGTYCDTTGAEIYLTCPPGTSSPQGSDTLNNCICLAGHQGTSTKASCTACIAGAYKSTSGTGMCEPCMSGTYSNITGSVACLTCPSQTSSSSGSDDLVDCKCVTGHNAMSDGLPCSPCDAGSYKATTGAGVCVVCPALHTSSKPGSDALADCQCAAGFAPWLGRALCMPCETGKFKGVIGPEQCTDCESELTYSPVTGAAECIQCPENEESAGVFCYCKQGYEREEESMLCVFGNGGSVFTLELAVRIENANMSSFTMNSSDGSQDTFIFSLSKGLGIARKSLKIISINIVPATGRRLLETGSIEVTVEITASSETTDSVVTRIQEGNLTIDYPGTQVRRVAVISGVDNSVVYIESGQATPTPTTSPAIQETPIPTIAIGIILTISGAGIVIIACVCMVYLRYHQSPKLPHISSHAMSNSHQVLDPLINIVLPHHFIRKETVSLDVSRLYSLR